MSVDLELATISSIMRALSKLPDDDSRERVMIYVAARRTASWVPQARPPRASKDDTGDMFDEVPPPAEAAPQARRARANA